MAAQFSLRLVFFWKGK